MLRVDVRALRQGPVRTDGVVAPDHPALAGLDVRLERPLDVSGVLSETVDGNFVWRATARGAAVGACRRCLTQVVTEFEVPVDAVFSSNPDIESDPSVYPLVDPVLAVDLSEALREEVTLAVPPFPLCREECAGLCQRCGADLNAGACACGAPAEPV